MHFSAGAWEMGTINGGRQNFTVKSSSSGVHLLVSETPSLLLICDFNLPPSLFPHLSSRGENGSFKGGCDDTR